MVAAGVGDQVDIVLYVIGDRRYALPDLADVSIDAEALTFDFDQSDSNYLRLRDVALAENGGHSVLTSYARDNAFNLPISVSTASGAVASTFWDLYFSEAADTGDDSLMMRCREPNPSPLESDAAITDNPELTTLPNSAAFICNGHSDLAAAMVGQRPADTWLTRLEMRLPRTALAMDCAVEPAPRQSEVNNQWVAARSSGRPDGCGEVVFASSVASVRPKPPDGAGLMVLLLALTGLGRRYLCKLAQ
jgi:hypothetical protein